MTLYELVRHIEEVAAQQPNINLIVENDIDKLNTLADAEYGAFAYVMGQHSASLNSDYINYNLTFYYVDRLTADGSNLLEVQNVAIRTLDNVIRTLVERCPEVSVGDYNFQYDTHSFADQCAGVYTAVTIRAMRDSVCCQDYNGKDGEDGSGMTLYELTKRIEEVATAQPNINLIVDNDIYKLNSIANAEYGVFAYVMGQHSANASTDFVNYKFTLYYVDRLTENDGNVLEVQSVGVQTLDNIIRTLVARYPSIKVSDYTLQPFLHSFADECAGVYMQVAIRTLRDSMCEQDFLPETREWHNSMTLYELVRGIEQVASAQPNINLIVENDIDKLNTLASAEYGVFGYTMGQHSTNASSDFVSYTFNLYYIDRLTEDDGNLLEIHNVGTRTLDNILRSLAHKYPAIAVGDYTFQPFLHSYTDRCAGVSVSVTIRALRDSMCCEMFGDDREGFDFNADYNSDFFIAELKKYGINKRVI